MNVPPAPIRWLVDTLEPALSAFAELSSTFDEAVGATIDGLADGLLAVPQPVLVAVIGVAIWLSGSLVRAVIAILGLHVVAAVGAWSGLITTLVFAAIVGGLGAGVAMGGRWLIERWRGSRSVWRPPMPAAALTAVSVFAVLVVAATPLVRGADHLGWLLAGIALAAVVTLALHPSAEARSGWTLVRAAATAGLTTSLLLGLAAGHGLGGSAVRAAGTADVVLAVQTLLALTGLGVALSAVLVGVGEPADSDGRPSRAQHGDQTGRPPTAEPQRVSQPVEGSS